MRANQSLVSHNRLIELLSYDPINGLFFWKKLNGKSHSDLLGSQAGYISTGDGRRRIRLERRSYLSSRLAWFYVHGVWPDQEIDHINMVKSDDRISNLRPASSTQNKINRVTENKIGFTGVWYSEKTKKYNAHLKINKKKVHLGSFPTAEAAHAAYLLKATEVHGDFVRRSACAQT